MFHALRNPVVRQPKWWVINAEGHRVGRLASQIAYLLQGKHKPIYTRSIDVGDYVVVVNASKVEFTGQKWQKKMVRWYTGYPGGLRERTAGQYHQQFPTRILQHAVMGMLPKNAMREVRENRLRIFAGGDHTHHSQDPEPYALHRTKGADLQAPWGLVPEYKMTFEQQGEGEEAFWVLKTEEPVVKGKEKREHQRLKRTGKLGASQSKKPHPDGYIRGGAPRPGVKNY